METNEIDFTARIQDLLKTINMKIRHVMIKAFTDYELTINQLFILKTIQNNPETNLTALGNHLNLAKSSICLMINKLVEEGYVQRVEDKFDRRNKTIGLTNIGEKVLTEYKAESRKIFSSLISHISIDDLLEIEKSLSVLSQSINDVIDKDAK